MSDDGPIFFFKRGDPEWGWLCQWHAGKFEARKSATFIGKDGVSFSSPEGFVYHNAEQYMMWHKARAFSDDATALAIQRTPEPQTCKSLGRRVRGFDAAVWDSIKTGVVAEGSYHKFAWDAALGARLLATGDRELVEASQWDRVWGIGFSVEHCRALDVRTRPPREDWGENLLGKAIMLARDRIRKEREERVREEAVERERVRGLIRRGK
ncbi:hypothetical protein PVAG01_02693 [Phlyctema vagabunda]|uniref:NADAR domain-containing protein n=1 Tax=Phlyctema vagabunda TaxID=108571 RepID=A0ABR4PRX6_9HELO